MNIRKEMRFAHRYDAEPLDELKSTAEVERFYFPGARREGGKDGVLVRVTAANEKEWFGVFAFGDQSGILLNGVFSCPAEDVLCVVSGGRGYLVHADKPEWWSEVPVTPITTVLQLTEAGLLIFADFTSLCAWDANGLVWRSKQLAWDDLVVTSCDGLTLLGHGFNPLESATVSFSVDVLTGEHKGGSSPEQYKRL
jgi:hypothetical protein